jgi:hypothetical protein
MAAAELPVQDAPIPPNASTAIAASGAPEQTGSPELITGEGALSARGPAMGPVAQIEEGREYSAEELDLLAQASTPPPPQEFSAEELDQEAVRLFDDPTYPITRDEYFELKATKERLKVEGKLPSGLEIAKQAVGGLVVTALDAFNTAVYSPLETIAKSPATMQTGIGRAALEAMKYSGYAKELIQGAPKYRDEETGEFFFYNNDVQLQNALESGRKLRPTTEDDLKDHEFEGYIAKKGIDAEYQDLATKTAPTELLTMLTTGRREQETPNLSQAGVIEMVADPTNLIPFGAGAKAIGLSRGMKVLSSEAANAVEKVAGGFVKGNDALAERFANVVTNATGFTPRDISAAGKVLNFGKNVGIGGGIAAGAAAVGAPPELAATIAGFYPVYKAGFGVLRKIETGAGTAKIILRESADATNGLDQAARAAVLANDAVPQAFKEVLERPSQFVSIESTPARLAANQALSPQMRALASKLSNPAIVQAVRGSSAVATGAVKGAAINAPFSLLAANAGDDEEAAAILGAGAAFGAAGGGVQRFTGLQQRRQQAAISDVSRMLVDVELNGGDVSKMMSTQTPDSLVKLAAMQGTFRNALDFVPLNSTDYNANVQAQGGAGSAGLFVQSAPGERAKVFINLDAKRTGIEPHEFGHALLASGALDGQQKYAARAWVDKTYGPEGVQARAAEYASSIIRGKNSEAFPDGNFEITPTTLSSEMENLSQGGLARGDMDGLDWARDEIFAETFAQASQSMDFAAIRRGAPAGENFLTFAEGILGAQARSLTASGIRIDGQTGRPLDTPGSLFKENPLLATDKALLSQLGTYINNYRQWANNPTHEKPAGVKIAPSGRASDLANNPQVTFYDRGDGVKANAFAIQDPVTGQAILRDQRDLNAEHAKVKAQLKALGGSKLLEPNNPVLGPKKTADGRVTIRGKTLPQSFDFLNGFMPHIRNFARQFEQFGQTGESMQVRYHAIGSGDSGAFQVKKLGNLEAITREVIPFEWQLTKAGNLNAVLLDLTQFRNRAMRAINDRNDALAPFNWELSQVETDLKQWMDNHRNNLPGENKIGTAKRDAINSLVGIATNYNRGKNPLNGAFGPGSAIKQFRLDRVDAAVGTGRQGFHFDYDKANGNFMPDKPAPMPDLSKDLPGQAMPEMPSTRVQFGRTGQTYSIIAPGQAMPEAYHGTPHKVDKFSTEKIGTGEGAQAYGWGLYFAENRDVAETYRKGMAPEFETPSGRVKFPEMDFSDEALAADYLNRHNGDFAKAMADQETFAAKNSDNPISVRSSAKVRSLLEKWKEDGWKWVKPDSNLYTVDLDVDDADLLDWDKPLSEQSEKVQQALAKARGDIEDWKSAFRNPQSALAGRRGEAAYSDVMLARKTDMKGASQALLEAGIPGIRYLDGGSGSNSSVWKDGNQWAVTFADPSAGQSTTRRFPNEKEARAFDASLERTYNYVIFDENLIKIKAENGQPVFPQNLSRDLPTVTGQGMPDETSGQPSRSGPDARDYRGQHKAPNFESAPAFDLTGNGVYPKDVYSRPDWYEQDMGLEEMRKIQRFQGNPEAPVWIHRAIPKNIYDNAMLEGERTGNSPLSLLIKEGDWVTTNKQYAKDHGEGALNGDFKVVSKRVKAGDIFTNGDSIFEWGYYPSNPNSPAPAPGATPGQAMPDSVLGRAKDMPMSALKVLHADSSTLPKPDKKTTNAKVALQLADAAEKHYGGKVTSSNITPEIESDLITVGSDEAEAALKASGKNAASWYSTAIQAALAVAGTIHRSLSDLNVAKQNKFFAKESDPVKAAQFALRIPLAITSQNMTVPLNARYANEQFDIFSKTGKFDPSKSYGEKAKSISGNLQLANDMIDAFGGITALEAFVSKEFTVRDLEAVASKAAGRKVTIAGRKEDMVNGAAIFGPKIGQGFLQNLMGNFDPVTIDLWMRRTWGRWTGDVVGDGVTATRLGRIIQEYRNSGRKLPDLIKRLRTVERSTGVTSTGKPKKPELTVSEDVEARIDNDPAFRKEIEAFAKEANAEFQGYYKLISQPMSLDEVKRINKAFQDAQANQDKADSIIQNAFTTTVRRQQAIKTMLDQKWDGMSPEQKKKLNEQNPQKAIAKDAWVAMQHAAQKRTEVLPNEIKNALKPNWANAAKSIVSELNPIDIPSDLDRRVISRVVNGIREEMGRRGYSLTNADVQAILWYPEKDLWAKLRGEQESGLKQSYDDEFIKIAEDLGLGSEAREVANRIRGY